MNIFVQIYKTERLVKSAVCPRGYRFGQISTSNFHIELFTRHSVGTYSSLESFNLFKTFLVCKTELKNI